MKTKNICKYSLNPSVEYARRSTDHKRSFKLLSSISTTVVVSPAYSLQPTASIRSVGIVTFLLLFSFLQPWRLVASTPGAEEFLKYVTEEGACLVDEVIEEEGSINHHIIINIEQEAAQTVSHTVEERIPREISLTNTHSITDPTSLSLFTETPETTAPVEQSVNSLNGNFIVQVLPTETMPLPILTGKSLGDCILALPPELISIFLRSPEKKQAVYKAEHQQTVLELQGKYPQLTYPELAQKITAWKGAVEKWSECPIPAEKNLRYQRVDVLASTMPPELYRLVALSQAMKIMENTTAYAYYLPRVLEKYSKDPKSKAYQAFFFQKIDIVNNNIIKLEKAADTVITLSEQKNRCLTFAVIATVAENTNIAEQFQAAARTTEQAISSYCEFAQKMKERDLTTAYLFRIAGFSLECYALEKEYRAQAASANNRGRAQESWDFQNAADKADSATKALNQAAQTRNEGKVEVAKTYEQAARYHFQAAQTAIYGDSTEVENFSDAARYLDDAAV
ncbi:MAG TPA: hypothetical protein VJK54_02970, partial [Chthoniobacterales bacterium]|nr:hypothetical protein [Chthoniobacterales bacterium]